MEDMIAVDAMLSNRATPTFLLPERGVQSYIVVPRRAFDDDLMRAFPHRDAERAVKAQVLVDAPRCRLEVEGVRVHSSIPDALSEDVRMLAVCTQAVVGLPVELLHRSVGLVMEPSRDSTLDRGLTIRAWSGGDFIAHKRLLIYYDDQLIPIVLLVQGGDDDVFMSVIRDRL